NAQMPSSLRTYSLSSGVFLLGIELACKGRFRVPQQRMYSQTRMCRIRTCPTATDGRVTVTGLGAGSGLTPIEAHAVNCCDPILMKLSVVMPVYNECATLRTVIERVLGVPLEIELLCVDDGSRDGSREILTQLESEHPQIRVLLQPQNMGKGAALRRGIQEAS